MNHLAQAYLTHLQIFLQSKDPDDRPARTFLDSWYAYDRGGPFLEKNGRPLWVNNPDPRKLGNVLLAMDFVSAAARERISQGEMGLCKDHAVPVKIIVQKLRALQDTSLNAIEHVLRHLYAVGAITKEEHARLDQKRLKSCMPNDWDGVDKFARYAAVGITDTRRDALDVTTSLAIPVRCASEAHSAEASLKN